MSQVAAEDGSRDHPVGVEPVSQSMVAQPLGELEVPPRVGYLAEVGQTSQPGKITSKILDSNS